MKKLIIALASALMLTACGVGSYSVAGGMSDDASISVTSSQKNVMVTVIVDGTPKNVQAVFQQDFKTNRNIKKTAQNTISIPKGNHDIKVYQNGQEVYSKSVLLGAGEHRIINL